MFVQCEKGDNKTKWIYRDELLLNIIAKRRELNKACLYNIPKWIYKVKLKIIAERGVLHQRWWEKRDNITKWIYRDKLLKIIAKRGELNKICQFSRRQGDNIPKRIYQDKLKLKIIAERGVLMLNSGDIFEKEYKL